MDRCTPKLALSCILVLTNKNKQYEYIGGTGPEEETDDWNDDWPVDYTYEKAEKRAIDYCLTHLL